MTAVISADVPAIAQSKECCKITAVDVATQYASCVYFAVSLFLGLGLRRTAGEKYAAFAIFGACLQACVFGSVAVIIAGLDADEAKYQQKLGGIIQRMRKWVCPYRQLLIYYDMMCDIEHGSDKEADAFIEDLSPALQSDVRLCMFHTLITSVPFLANPSISTTAVEDIVMRIKTLVYLPETSFARASAPTGWASSARAARRSCWTRTRTRTAS